MTKNIPCVIIHKKYKPYLKLNLEITSKNNEIYLIGDNSLKFLANNKNITFIDIDKYEKSESLNFFKKHFINYSTNSFEFEWFCFARMFILKEFIKEYNLEQIFYIDSDNLLLTDINEIKFKNNVAYLIPQNQHKNRMTASIHSSLLNSWYCNIFSDLFEQIFVNKNKFNLIDEKINFHKENNVKGGICDMTLHFLIYQEYKDKIQNIIFPSYTKGGEKVVFMNVFSNGEGPISKNNYLLKNNKLKIFEGNKILDIVENEKIKVCNIHYQGSSKKYLKRYTKYFLKF